VLHTQLVILPTMHLTVDVSGGIMSRPRKRAQLLQPSKISELTDTDSDKARVSSNIGSVEGGFENVPGVSQPQLYCQTASHHKSSSSILSSASEEEDAGKRGPGEQTQQPVSLQWTCPSCPQSSVAHTHTHTHRGPQRKEGQ
jgi:hypothetical protein